MRDIVRKSLDVVSWVGVRTLFINTNSYRHESPSKPGVHCRFRPRTQVLNHDPTTRTEALTFPAP
jgi:hypothetical protein